METHLQENGTQLAQFLEEGNYGPQVQLLQTLLAERGFFPTEEINDNFGPLTRKAVRDYQLSAGIIERPGDHGAGVVGPETLAKLRLEEKKKLYYLVRAEGWRVL